MAVSLWYRSVSGPHSSSLRESSWRAKRWAKRDLAAWQQQPKASAILFKPTGGVSSGRQHADKYICGHLRKPLTLSLLCLLSGLINRISSSSRCCFGVQEEWTRLLQPVCTLETDRWAPPFPLLSHNSNLFLPEEKHQYLPKHREASQYSLIPRWCVLFQCQSPSYCASSTTFMHIFPPCK